LTRRCGRRTIKSLREEENEEFSHLMVRQENKKTKKQTMVDGETLQFAGKQEIKAMELLHTMFIENFAMKSDMMAFEAKKKSIDRKLIISGAREALKPCMEHQ